MRESSRPDDDLGAELPEPAALNRSWDLAALRGQFSATSWCSVDGLWSERLAAALRREAEGEMTRATLAFSNAYAALAGGGLSGPVLH